MVPFLAAALPSLIAGAFSAFGPNAGAQRKQLKYQNQVMHNQIGVMQQLRQYGNSPIGSDPLEAANFANQRAQLGQQQNQQQQDLLSQYNRNQGQNGLGDFQNNLQSRNVAQQMALNAQNNLAAMQNRRQSLLQSAQVGQAVPNYQAPSNGLPELFSSLAQTWAHQQELNKQNKGQQQQNLLMAQAAHAGNPVAGTNGIPLNMPGVQGSLQSPGPWAGGYGLPHDMYPGSPGNSGNLTTADRRPPIYGNPTQGMGGWESYNPYQAAG